MRALGHPTNIIIEACFVIERRGIIIGSDFDPVPQCTFTCEYRRIVSESYFDPLPFWAVLALAQSIGNDPCKGHMLARATAIDD